jgi:putative ABC transport system substrate-binding protein
VGLVQVDNPALLLPWESFKVVAQAVGIQADAVNLKNADELEAAFEGDVLGHAQAFLDYANPILLPVRARLAELAIQHHLPGYSGTLAFVRAGLLVGYGVNLADEARRVAVTVDKIIKGANAGDLPVEQPTVFDLLVNTTTLHA